MKKNKNIIFLIISVLSFIIALIFAFRLNNELITDERILGAYNLFAVIGIIFFVIFIVFTSKSKKQRKQNENIEKMQNDIN